MVCIDWCLFRVANRDAPVLGVTGMPGAATVVHGCRMAPSCVHPFR